MTAPQGLRADDERAFTAMLGHHAQLRREMDERVAALRAVVADSAPSEQARFALREFLEGDVLPHAIAEEAALYSVAAKDSATSLLVDAMVTEHRALTERVRAVAGAGTPVEALASAEATAAIFAVHVDKENELLLPALARTPEVSLAGLLEDMHHRMEELRSGHDA